MSTPSAFSAHNPQLQVAWDSTSIGSFMFCPRRYEYEILNGYVGSSTDLEFGIMFHKAVEVFTRARLSGSTRDAAQLLALRCALDISGRRTEEGAWVPWGGCYVDQWRCTGTEPYKNEKGNKAKCPFSHKGHFFPTPGPSICGQCGSAVEVASNWLPIAPAKDRLTLIRLVVWYCEEQPTDLRDGVLPVSFADGTAAVELPFRIPMPWKNGHGETIILCGYLDRIVTFGTEGLTVDLKTTKKGLTKGYFETFAPNIQFDIYDLAGALLFPDWALRGIMVDAAQTLVGGANFGKHIVYHTDTQREELIEDLRYWTEQAEAAAKRGYWPMNRRNCWLCPFKGVCRMEPGKRKMFLDANFSRREWNPLAER